MDRSYVVLASTAYAGSTMLSFLLGAHPEISTTSEVSGTRREHQMDGFECSCRARMVDCEFWQAVRAAMRARGYADFELANFGLGFDYRGPGWPSRIVMGGLPIPAFEPTRDVLVRALPGHRARMAAIADRSRAFAEVVMELTGTHAFVDASKERMRLLHLYRLLHGSMDVRVIHLVRDVRGVVESTLRRSKKPNLTAAGAARNWADTNAIILRNMAALPDGQKTTVRYEDLCRDPEGTMARLYRFCGADPDIRLADVAGSPQHLLGNRMRLDGVGEISLDERWRAALEPPQLAAIGRVAARVHTRLYPDGDSLAVGARG
jgi:hypothetical protein